MGQDTVLHPPSGSGEGMAEINMGNDPGHLLHCISIFSGQCCLSILRLHELAAPLLCACVLVGAASCSLGFLGWHSPGKSLGRAAVPQGYGAGRAQALISACFSGLRCFISCQQSGCDVGHTAPSSRWLLPQQHGQQRCVQGSEPF